MAKTDVNIYVVSHTHWDREWYMTYEQFRMRLVELIDRLLEHFEKDEDYKHFHFDGQTICLEDYLEIRPENTEKMGIKSYRFSFSWSRIFPEGVGKVNQKGVDFYKRMIDEMLKRNIVPNATLYHWDLPYELECKGGWLNRDCAKWFGEYASEMFRLFGDVIPIWSTINEPIAMYVGYALGIFAPGKKLDKFGKQANHNILLAYGEGVQAFRAQNPKDSKIGIVIDMWHRHPANPMSLADVRLAEKENKESYKFYMNAIFKGRYSDYMLDKMEKDGTTPYLEEEDFNLISQPIDFFGLNCYNRVVVSADKERKINESVGGNFLDNGTEFYPRAIYDAIHIAQEEFGVNIPIYITENGTYNCNEEIVDGEIHDRDRIQYVEGFLTWLKKAMDEGADIRGYYLWTLMDNFEWSSGTQSRFGIVHTDFATQQRILKDSALWYKKVIESNGECLS